MELEAREDLTNCIVITLIFDRSTELKFWRVGISIGL